MTAREAIKSDDLVRRYLPAQFHERIPVQDRSWRGRIVLLLWASGYPLEMAWSIGMTNDPDQVPFYKEAVPQVDDERLVQQLDATAATRGDDGHLEFLWLGGIEDDERGYWVLVRQARLV